MSNTSTGRKYQPCPTPQQPTLARRAIALILAVAELAIWLAVAVIILAVVGKWLGV
ncbi:MAG: hypothetical protein VXW65_02335 [Pseudomonadota bacterium]|nr:hypothetical protein [Pseudomonadota bacterium]